MKNQTIADVEEIFASKPKQKPSLENDDIRRKEIEDYLKKMPDDGSGMQTLPFKDKVSMVWASATPVEMYSPLAIAFLGVGVAFAHYKTPSSKQITIFAGVGLLVGLLPMALKYSKLPNELETGEAQKKISTSGQPAEVKAGTMPEETKKRTLAINTTLKK